jgi:hypothetical protein
VVVRRNMNGTGVLKVYLIQSKKYAYRLKFQRARAPQWVLDALNMITKDATIGFEDENEIGLPVIPESFIQSLQTRARSDGSINGEYWNRGGVGLAR